MEDSPLQTGANGQEGRGGERSDEAAAAPAMPRRAPSAPQEEIAAPEFSPSLYMRRLRPEQFSDTEAGTRYVVERAVLEHALDSITARNETHEFEIFCRKLCERAICPNLRPATGPEGGGDSKADSETVLVSEEIAALWYTAEPNAERERWAFAFSAKRRWAQKVRDDVAGLIATGRPYDRIYCVTARSARDRDRARVEDELTAEHGLPVTILDRSWIVNEIVDKHREALAVHYLGVGSEVIDSFGLGPGDYSRARELAEIERLLDDPAAYAGKESQRATDALLAAKLSRGLERPRHETDGRFARALRLADRGGWAWHRSSARYEQIRTAYWWFDDVDPLLSEFDRFVDREPLGESALHLERTVVLLQLLFNAVAHGGVSAEQAELEERVRRVSGQLSSIAADPIRPNAALEAEVALLLIEVHRAALDGRVEALSALWPKFGDVIARARGLGDFDAERLIQLIGIFGHAAVGTDGYDTLVERVADFVRERHGSAEGAMVRLRHARALGQSRPTETIRVLGSAIVALQKREYADSAIEASALLVAAYRSAGLLWAARATATYTVARIVNRADESGSLPSLAIAVLLDLHDVLLELSHLPDLLHIRRLARGALAVSPPSQEAVKTIEAHFASTDAALSVQLLRLPREVLDELANVPDVLDGLDMPCSRMVLLHVLGYDDVLVEEGWEDRDDGHGTLNDCFARLERDTPVDVVARPIVLNATSPGNLSTRVLGMTLTACHDGSTVAISLAEMVLATIETVFGTLLDHPVLPHVERFDVHLRLDVDIDEPNISVSRDTLSAVVRWPGTSAPADLSGATPLFESLVELAARILIDTCALPDAGSTLDTLIGSDRVFERLTLVTTSAARYSDVHGRSVARLEDWTSEIADTWPPRGSGARTAPTADETDTDRVGREGERETRCVPASDPVSAHAPEPRRPDIRDHRDVSVHSVIDVHSWNEAKWRGLGVVLTGQHEPPLAALLFENEVAARRIFTRWRERFGTTDQHEEIHVVLITHVSAQYPSYYRVLVTSRPRIASSRPDVVLSLTARWMEMNPDSDQNLRMLLDAHSRIGYYRLVPMVARSNGPPFVGAEFGILKRNLRVVRADDVGEHDFERIALTGSP